MKAHFGHSLAACCFHADIRHGQKLHQNLLHILLVEQLAILSYTHSWNVKLVPLGFPNL